MKIIVINFHAPEAAIPANLGSVVRRGRVIGMIVTIDVSSAMPAVYPAPCVSVRVIKAVVLDKNELLASVKSWISP